MVATGKIGEEGWGVKSYFPVGKSSSGTATIICKFDGCSLLHKFVWGQTGHSAGWISRSDGNIDHSVIRISRLVISVA